MAMSESVDWLLESFHVNNDMGSSGTRSLRGKWGAVYPETTGYIVPTLYKAGELVGNDEACKVALKQIEFFSNIQNENGSFWQAMDNQSPIVFDTAQIVEGLLFIAHMSKKPRPILKMINRAVDWLGTQLDDEGRFVDHHYVPDHDPAYYARIAWLMAAGELIKYSKPRTKTKKLITRIVGLQNENKSFKDWGFHPDQPAHTHTIAYTFRGLWECANMLNDRKLRKQVRSSVHMLSHTIEEQGGIAGAYDESWQGDSAYICAVGNAQLAILYLLMYQHSGSKKYLKHVTDLMKPLVKSQRPKLVHRGAIPSSIPMSGKYQKLKYTNWTQKFYCDALYMLLTMEDRKEFVGT